MSGVILCPPLHHVTFTHEAPDGTLRAWDVTRAQQIVQDGRQSLLFSLPDHGVTIDKIRELYSEVDEAYAMTTDLARPLIFIPFFGESLLIDGWHRLYKAASSGNEDVLIYTSLPDGSGPHSMAGAPAGSRARVEIVSAFWLSMERSSDVTRFAFGVTLSPAERALFTGGPGSRSSLVRSHTYVVTLPDRTTCQVSYTRYNHRSHRFDFGSPVHQRIWIDPYLDGSVAAVEAKAQEVAAQAFAQAQEVEQKQMRRKSVPAGSKKPDRKDPLCLSCKIADQFAGKYAACLKSAHGTYMRIGDAYDAPESVAQELQSGKHDHYALADGQEIVIGICNRSLRRWEEPRLLINRPRIRGSGSADRERPCPSEAKGSRPGRSRPRKTQ